MFNILLKLITPLFYSALFATIESVYYLIMNGFMYTTIDQTIISFCLSPFIIQIDRMLTAEGVSIMHLALLYPFIFWTAEIVGGFTLLYLFGHNRAWYYYSDDALLYGIIRIYYYPLFSLLGVSLHYVDYYLQLFCEQLYSG